MSIHKGLVFYKHFVSAKSAIMLPFHLKMNSESPFDLIVNLQILFCTCINKRHLSENSKRCTRSFQAYRSEASQKGKLVSNETKQLTNQSLLKSNLSYQNPHYLFHNFMNNSSQKEWAKSKLKSQPSCIIVKERHRVPAVYYVKNKLSGSTLRGTITSQGHGTVN